MATASLVRGSSSPRSSRGGSSYPSNSTLSPRTRICHNSSTIERCQSPVHRLPIVCMATSVASQEDNLCMESSQTAQQPRTPCDHGAATATDLYDLLGVKHSATGDDIKRAFRQQARKLHPDLNHTAGAEKLFLELKHAYEVLSDSSSRLRYDTELRLEAAKANDPRFARYNEWRAEVVPGLQLKLVSWTKEVDAVIEEASQCLTSMALEVDRRLDALSAMAVMVEDCGSAQLRSDYLEQADRLLDCVNCRLAAMDADLEAVQNRIKLLHDRRYTELLGQYRQYPDLVWIDIWEGVSGQWLLAASGNCSVWRTDKKALEAQVLKVAAEYQKMAANAPKVMANV